MHKYNVCSAALNICSAKLIFGLSWVLSYLLSYNRFCERCGTTTIKAGRRQQSSGRPRGGSVRRCHSVGSGALRRLGLAGGACDLPAAGLDCRPASDLCRSHIRGRHNCVRNPWARLQCKSGLDPKWLTVKPACAARSCSCMVEMTLLALVANLRVTELCLCVQGSFTRYCRRTLWQF